MTLFTASAYLLCLAFLLASAIFVLTQHPRSKLHQSYALLALSLLAWVATLFVFDGLPEGHALLAIGRANFAAAALVGTASFLFAAELAGRRPRMLTAVWMETILLVALSLGTPFVDKAETLVNAQHVTDYGTLFPLYSLHVVAFLAAAVYAAFQAAHRAPGRLRSQLLLVGSGILATALVGVTTNIVLPYAFADFRFINVGTLSTILFLGAIAYAVFAAHLFSIKLIVRAAFVYAGLITLALELYQLCITFLSRLLPLGDREARGYAATAVALTVNAFTQQPVKEWLEHLVDRITRDLPHQEHRRSRLGRSHVSRDRAVDAPGS